MSESFRSSPVSPFRPRTGGAWNEMTDGAGGVRPHWQRLAAHFGNWSIDERGAVASAAQRMVEDLGTTFNVFSDVGGVGQPYELDPLPLVISPEEWELVSAGLDQRIRLLDAVLADLYGPQSLMSQGLVPPDLVHSNPAFLHYACGVQPPGGKHLVATGCDLVRTPAGAWTVLQDHTGTTGGLGQVYENRNVISNLFSEPFDEIRVARMGGFLEAERSVFRAFSVARGDDPNVVFLTPGFRHPSYFEHAYQARLLGFPLVEMADLTVREQRLYLKTLAGLRRIDGVICRVDHHGIDPLENGGYGGDGVPGMVEAWRTGNVALANSPGSGFAASPALLPFLPGICREWFGEELKLPFVETWWLGQEDVRHQLLDQWNRFVLLPAVPGSDPQLPVQCSALSPVARKYWLNAIEERPHDFVLQANVTPSEAPSLERRTIRQQPVVWRAFTLNAAEAPLVMPGGLARVGNSQRPPQLWPAHEGFTKDVWIPGAAELSPKAEMMKAPRSSRGRPSSAPEVPSRIAEQLYWVGRYAERIELATRLLRVTLRCLSGEAGPRQHDQLAACFCLISGAGLVPAGAVQPNQALKTIAGFVHDPSSGTGIPALTRALLVNAAAVRDRLSDDTWRFFNRLESLVSAPESMPGAGELLRTLDGLVLHFAAFSGMQAENMTRGHGWRFLEVGRRIERALGGLRLLFAAALPGQQSANILEPLLETCDSVMTYRRRHFSRPRLDAVVDLIFFDAGNPRSVAYQIGVIHVETSRFPGMPHVGLMPKIRHQIQSLQTRFDESAAPDAGDFREMIAGLEAYSDLLTQHFFSHSVRRVY